MEAQYALMHHSQLVFSLRGWFWAFKMKEIGAEPSKLPPNLVKKWLDLSAACI